MRKPIYESKIAPNLEEMKKLRQEGMSLRNIGRAFGVSAPTVSRYLGEKEKASEEECLKALDPQVEQALFRACVGYTADVVKHHKVKRVEYDETTGKKVSETEEMVQAIDKVHVPPSIMAQRFYLSCRMPEKWNAKPSPEQEAEEGGVIVIPEIIQDTEGFDE